MGPIRFVNTSGLKLAGLGSTMQIIAGVWNEIVHHVFSSDPKVAPAHALLTLGMLTISLGMIVGLSIEYGMIRQRVLVASSVRRHIVLLCMILIFASIWLTAAGSIIYVARVFRDNPLNWITALLLSIVGPIVLVPAKRLLPQFGSGIAIGLAFNFVSYFFLVAYADAPVYVPWGILPLILLDVSLAGLGRIVIPARAVAISSTFLGFLFPLTYYPFTLYLFRWSFAADPTLVMVFIGGILGVILGTRVYSSISSLALRDLLKNSSATL